MGENQGGEEEKTPRGKKRKREGDPEVIKTITTFIDDKFKNVLKEAVLKDDSDLTDPIIQIGVKMYITDLLSKSKGALATGVCRTLMIIQQQGALMLDLQQAADPYNKRLF